MTVPRATVSTATSIPSAHRTSGFCHSELYWCSEKGDSFAESIALVAIVSPRACNEGTASSFLLFLALRHSGPTFLAPRYKSDTARRIHRLSILAMTRCPSDESARKPYGARNKLYTTGVAVNNSGPPGAFVACGSDISLSYTRQRQKSL